MVEVAWDHAISEMANGLKTAISKENLARTAVLIAPQISTGALYLLKKLMEKMGVDNVDHRLPSVVPGELDHLLQMRDRNPNSFTAEILGLIPIRGGLRYRQILEGIKADKVQYLMAICCDPLELMEGDREALKKLKFLGLLHWSRSPGLDLASVALPLATFAESEGVFVNFQGRVQRFSKAVEPAGESKPAWQVLMMLGRELGYKFKVHSEAEVFNEFASSYDMFKGLTWDKIGSQGQSGATI
jgi:predicted molibdopterin-dependent oxidoreductase YjgC